MTAGEFSTAMREPGFGVDHGRIVDVSGQCPRFATLPSFDKGAVDRNATLSKSFGSATLRSGVGLKRNERRSDLGTARALPSTSRRDVLAL
jgi:hypothetical protein